MMVNTIPFYYFLKNFTKGDLMTMSKIDQYCELLKNRQNPWFCDYLWPSTWSPVSGIYFFGINMSAVFTLLVKVYKIRIK